MKNIFKIAICDDNKIFAERLQHSVESIIKANGDESVIECFADGTEVLQYCKKNAVDILILDIDMPVMSGFEVMEELGKTQPNLSVIFVTSHDELAYQAYDYQPFWFVSKSDLDKMDDILTKLINKIKTMKIQNDVVTLNLTNIVHINISEVMYLKSDKNYIDAVSIGGGSFRFRAALKDVYEQLADYGFIYAIRGYVVNCRFIDKLDKKRNSILLKNDLELPMTNDAKIIKEIDRIYGKFLREARL